MTKPAAVPAWVPAQERKPAPEPLLLVQSFVNTRNVEEGTDLLADPGRARAWLREAGLLGPHASAGDLELRAARDAREGIRSMIEFGGARPAPPAGLSALEAVTRTARPRITVGQGGQVGLGSAAPERLVDGLLNLLIIIRDAQRDGTWRRLKACGNPGCRWIFYDRSHSHRGAWCDMASCGNMIKNRNLRARRASQAQPGGRRR